MRDFKGGWTGPPHPILTGGLRSANQCVVLQKLMTVSVRDLAELCLGDEPVNSKIKFVPDRSPIQDFLHENSLDRGILLDDETVLVDDVLV
jgi:hypothetical protein